MCAFFNDSRDGFAASLVAACEKLSPAARGCPVPSIDTVNNILQRVTTDKVTKAHRARWPGVGWRFLSRPRHSCDDTAAVFLERLRWHTGRGSANLTGVYMARFRVSGARWELLDTLATVAAILAGCENSNSAVWQKILGIDTTTTAGTGGAS